MSSDDIEISVQSGLNSKQKWIVAVIGAILFVILCSPYTFALLGQITGSFGLDTANLTGLPTIAGLIIMSVIFLLLARLLLR